MGRGGREGLREGRGGGKEGAGGAGQKVWFYAFLGCRRHSKPAERAFLQLLLAGLAVRGRLVLGPNLRAEKMFGCTALFFFNILIQPDIL